MRDATQAARDLLDKGWTIQEVINVLGDQQAHPPTFYPAPTVAPLIPDPGIFPMLPYEPNIPMRDDTTTITWTGIHPVLSENEGAQA